MARNQKLSYKMNMNMFHFLTKQNYSKYSEILGGRSFEGAFIRGNTVHGKHARENQTLITFLTTENLS